MKMRFLVCLALLNVVAITANANKPGDRGCPACDCALDKAAN